LCGGYVKKANGASVEGPRSGKAPKEVIADTDAFSIHFWGVRGTIPCAASSTLRYGGNTACVEMRCGQQRLIFDAGTGLRQLGREMVSN